MLFSYVIFCPLVIVLIAKLVSSIVSVKHLLYIVVYPRLLIGI